MSCITETIATNRAARVANFGRADFHLETIVGPRIVSAISPRFDSGRIEPKASKETT